MPEYLAPGVYVEETSFRAKSIEGVGTSTCGFAGPTRTGPLDETPELLTSFADFERLYGGLEALSWAPDDPHYLAHAVRAFFNEGGSRLYVARVFLPAQGGDGRARSDLLLPPAQGAVHFAARQPGSGGNGRLVLTQQATPANVRTLETAPEGSLLRIAQAPTGTVLSEDTLVLAAPAQLTGGSGPTFALPDDGQLLLTVGGTDAAITFQGSPAEVVGDVNVPANVTLDETTRRLVVTVDDVQQTLTLPIGPTPAAELEDLINQQLRGGYAAVRGNNLVIGSDRRGTRANVAVAANSAFFTAATAATHAPDPAANNVGDLGNVTADEINAILAANTIAARAVLLPSGKLALVSTATGTDASLAVRSGADIVTAALGLTVATAQGASGADVTYYRKVGARWEKQGGGPPSVDTLNLGDRTKVQADLLTMTISAEEQGGRIVVYDGLGFDPLHRRYIGDVLPQQPRRRADALDNRYAIVNARSADSFALRAALFGAGDVRVVAIGNGSDGGAPIEATYEAALRQLLGLEDIAIVATPGSSALPDAQGIANALIRHADTRRAYRIAVLDTPPDAPLGEARATRSLFDSTHAALYYPWVMVSNPLAQPGNDSIPREIALPPSGFVCGIYARNDIERAVYKAPANEVVRSALRFQRDINFAEQEALNPLGINCLRFFPGRGFRVWGARTISSDPEWKYVNVRRYFNYLEASIDRGTQWAVFEPNGERLWANVRDTISAFLYNEWVSGALLGANPDQAFFVRCDRSTMTQNDLDNGRLICLVGVAPLRPAEFVIFRIGQKTVDERA